MQKSLVFKEKFKHIHHPGQTKYSMSVGIGCLSHLFAVSVPGQGSAVKTRFFFFLSADKFSSRWEAAQKACQPGMDHWSWAWPYRRLTVGNGEDTFSGRDKDKGTGKVSGVLKAVGRGRRA